MKRLLAGFVLSIIPLSIVPLTATSVSIDAWQAHEDTIATKCLAAVDAGENQLSEAKIIVDRYSSTALLIGYNDDYERVIKVCAYFSSNDSTAISFTLGYETLNTLLDETYLDDCDVRCKSW